jgi:hypothetical protein
VSLADLVTAGKVLGLPGVVILCWFLLARREADRQRTKDAQEAERTRANDKRNAALERMKIDAENRRTAALEVGFRSLGDQMNSHGERLAGIEGVLQIKRRQTPGMGVPVREVTRARTNGDR